MRLAVIGCGLVGRTHAELIDAHQGCSLTGICDVDPARRAIAEELDVPFYEDIGDLLDREKPEGAVIATPNADHATSAEVCAQRSVHVLIEKPIANTLDGARRIARLEEENEIRVLVGHHRRHSPLIREVRAVVQGGVLGKLVAVSMLWALFKPEDYFDVDWRCRRPDGGPTLINLIHELDILRCVCGEIGDVYARSSSAMRGLEVEDTVSVTLSLECGALASVIGSDTTPAPWSYEVTTGENPHYFHTRESCYHFLGTRGSLAFPRMELWKYAEGGPTGWKHALERSHRAVTPADPLRVQLDHFCRVLAGTEEPIVDARDGAASLAAALAVLESIASGAPVVPERV